MDEEEAGPRYSAPALEKGLDILELLAGTTLPLSMSEIAQRLDRSRNEIFRMVQVLERRGFIERVVDNGDHFRVSAKLFQLGMGSPRVQELAEVARPIMRDLAARTEQSCHLALPTGDSILVISRVEAPGGLGFAVRVGHNPKLVNAASGIVMYAFQPPEEQAHWRRRAGGDARAWRDVEGWAAEARARGHLVRPSLQVAGVIDLSAPIVQQGAAVAALTIPYLERLAPHMSRDDAATALMEAAALIARSGYA